MPKKAKRAINVPATPAKKPVKPSLASQIAGDIAREHSTPIVKPVKPVIATTKPVAVAKPVTLVRAAVKAAAAVPPVAAKPVADTSPRGLTRDAIGIVRYATNFNQYSGRDEAYLAFFGNVMRANGGKATLRQIHDAGITRSGMPDRKRYNPNYTGSGKATDIGAINRLAKAGYLDRSSDGNTLTATKLALASKAYSGGK